MRDDRSSGEVASARVTRRDPFWNLIDTARSACDPTSRDEANSQAAILERKLEALALHDVVEFDQLFRTLLARAYTWDLWAAAYVIGGGCSDDGFEYFRAGLIGLGRAAYEDAVRDPRTLVRQPAHGVDFENEPLLYAASNAYESISGREIPDSDIRQPSKPLGEMWDEDTVDEKYPELANKFGSR